MEEKEFSFKRYIIFAICMFIIIISAYILNFNEYKISENAGDWGTFGDFIGGTLNPTLAFLSFLALLQTIKIQSKELKETRKATEISSKTLTEQSNSIKIQNFENTFFNMLNLHNEIISNITIFQNISFGYNSNKWEKVTLYGDSNSIMSRKAIKLISDSFNNFIKNVNSYRKVPKIYDLCHESFQDILGHYFENIYQILKFISSNKDIQDKTKYSDLFRAQFSSAELELLFYHCTSHICSKDFKNYIEEFQFFEHLVVKENKSFNYIFSLNIYDDKAFGKNKEIIKTISLENKKFSEKIKNLENNKNKSGKELEELSKNYFYKKEYDSAINIINKIILNIENEMKEIENEIEEIEKIDHAFRKDSLKREELKKIDLKKIDLQKTYLLLSDIYFEMGNNEKGEEILSKI